MPYKKTKLWMSIIIASMLLQTSTVLGSNTSLNMVSEYAQKAIKMGYGAECSLGMKVVGVGGYYPCLDFGPYRIVVKYQEVAGFIIQKGFAPYKIFEGPEEKLVFIRNGPWNNDVVVQMTEWWSNVVEGGSIRKSEMKLQNTRQTAAERYIKSLQKKELPSADESPKEPKPVVPEREIIDIKRLMSVK